MTQATTDQMKAQAEQLDKASAILRGLIHQDKAPDARQIVNLLVLAVSHEQWVRGMFGGLVSEIEAKPDEQTSFGTGARGGNYFPRSVTGNP